MDRKLSAILAADVVGYSALMERDEAGTFERLRAGRKELFEPDIARHHGQIFKLMGDGMLAEFGSVVDAVECAVSLQRGLAERNAAVPEDQRIRVRIGINLGEVIVEGEDRYGEGVNVAARLQQLADPGGICVSGKVAREVEKKLAFGFEPMGEQKVKNIAEPVQAFRVILEGQAPRQPARSSPPRWVWAAAAVPVLILVLAGTVWQFWPTATVSGKPSVAVLPFDNYGGDEATGRLANGLTEDIITDLAGFPEFHVIARNSTEQYRDKPAAPSEVGKALGAGFVVEGSIQRQSDRVRITTQLSDAKTGKHLWSQRWDRPDEDLFAIQIEISEQISNRLGGGAGLVQEAGRITAHRKPPGNLNAYELYLLGTEKLEQVNQADVEEAVRLLTRAVELDPGLARAWVELSHSHGVLTGFGVEPDKNRVLSAEAAERAVQLDPSDAEAHAVYAIVLGDRGEFGRAKVEFDTALRLAPGQFEVLTFYIDWASTFGEPERTAELVDKAVSLNPGFPMWSARIFTHAYFMAGRYEDALRMLDRLTAENYGRKHWVMRSGALAALGRTEEAKVSVTDALRRFPNLTVEGFANIPGFNEAERQRLIETMRLVGFPDCAKAEELTKLKKPLRLPECASP
ncbi:MULTISPECIES: adenylate/guanylate cyclase domain-containing protein [Rhizobium]|uniref:Tetratricopeptide repeat protein n=1 Tax=Rhizobium indicum TaxID=2583231 RepID=A0ABX6PAY1_9HYPH|nr:MULTISPECIES: adenylate/guanylate cyclase domain-containing protein [Rhizobium]MBA1349697.1 tetratricopeptide repeat protein [Rhizobium sp. WYCCWR 11146]NNU66936.1 tetratricopeptide repeat protein [Rhizobium sp. WYCCWR 11152]NYT32913.1 tetratricopeptide repeat protein [Rhizobium sp. WYCCWR 11128]QKK16236.1 tetratricopeptide repeat protein [Rhizobium indicum]